MKKEFKMECMGEPVTLKLSRTSWNLHGYDFEAEQALIELGFEPSDCWFLYQGLMRADEPPREGWAIRSPTGPVLGINLALNKAAEMGMSSLVRFIVNDIVVTMGWRLLDLHDIYYALDLAAEEGHVEVVQELLSAGLPIDDGEADEAVQYAYHRGQSDVLDVFQAWFEMYVDREDWPHELLGKV